MKYIQRTALALITSLPLSAHSIVLTFDDHVNARQNDYGAIGSYNGFNFSGSNYLSRMDWIDTVDSQWDQGAISGDFTMLNNFGGSATITASDNSEFSFTGLYARMWYNNNRSFDGVKGYLDGALVFDIDVNLTQTWEYVAGNSLLIDELRLDLGNYYLVDNLELNGDISSNNSALNNDPSSVSEPSTLALFGLGLLGLGIARKKSKA